MVLEKYRKKLDLFFDPLTRLFGMVHPDVFSLLSFVFAVVAGVLYASSGHWVWDGPYGKYPWMILLALVFIGFNSIADTLDGRIARYMGRETMVGDFLDHTFDRLSDIAIMVGIAFSPYCNTTFGLISVAFVLMSSYMGTQAQALGCGRNYSGVMGRADRMVLLLFATIFQFLVMGGWGVKGLWIDLLGIRLVPLELTVGIMMVGGILTALSRGRDTYRYLVEKEAEEKRRKGRREKTGWKGTGTVRKRGGKDRFR
ncbi:MAG: CDP-alcohol phosphatidyltransferase family protein [Candidatus Thermoplasmatota archaeon]|nr:CDP-alcohol phosphatidyltransferase family protein [Candidatus Thermoplasmatota archaeon]